MTKSVFPSKQTFSPTSKLNFNNHVSLLTKRRGNPESKTKTKTKTFFPETVHKTFTKRSLDVQKKIAKCEIAKNEIFS